ncbi:hydantoinase B/oxoprolinase family protein [Halosegnis longus]|uniref:Hydantoinase B/oxoprolinase family protein n=1 Tax=Halosegnis longus TaxID=2216012 RepID=A0AAJ4UVS5_9EURY|nr:hydantoinase B/oxoprolinase family protein [Halosegnis longus]RNJ26316.1 hydantoinase B/oxoprolinase family protein [Salella cibi]
MSLDAVSLEVLRHQLSGIAEEMGHVLIHGAYSPNIKERQDCSTALFDAEGRMVAQAEHIPVHLGAMPEAVETVMARDPQPGDAYVLNDPFDGGTHLPDVTIVAPLVVEGEILGYGVTRAHHGDIGGMTPGSMPAGATEIYQEGLRLPAVRLVENGTLDEDVVSLVLANVRNPDERRADLRAQLAANDRANERIAELVESHGRERILDAFDAVIDYSRERTENEIATIPDGTYEARDVLEGDGVTDEPIPIAVTVTVDGETVAVDFDGTADQVDGNMNAPLSVAKSAVYFVVRAVTDPDIPPTDGCYQPVTVRAPAGSLLNPTQPAAVVGGNVETSQRVTDVVLAAFAEALPEEIPAQGQGTMNNLIIGGRTETDFTYYETIAGGFGGRPARDGMDGVQVGMTNTLNTPIEALEAEYPLRVESYTLRPNSGGDGRYRGGLGLVRSVTVEADATVSLLTERRQVSPAGTRGGNDGTTGENYIDGQRVPAKTTETVSAGTTVTVKTPGGGGYGDPDERAAEARANDRRDEKTGADADDT